MKVGYIRYHLYILYGKLQRRQAFASLRGDQDGINSSEKSSAITRMFSYVTTRRKTKNGREWQDKNDYIRRNKYIVLGEMVKETCGFS
jgi:hypothetical protein